MFMAGPWKAKGGGTNKGRLTEYQPQSKHGDSDLKGKTFEGGIRIIPSQWKDMRSRDADAPIDGLKLSTHVHKSTALVMHSCRSRAWVPHHTLHRRRIVELARHAHLHLQHWVDHVHPQIS